jgi:hypothetical protein
MVLRVFDRLVRELLDVVSERRRDRALIKAMESDCWLSPIPWAERHDARGRVLRRR